MNLYVIRRPSGWRTPEELQAAAARSKQVGDEEMSDDIRWIRSYVVHEADGSLGTFCIYQASSPEKIREHAARAGIPATDDLRGRRHRDRPARSGRRSRPECARDSRAPSAPFRGRRSAFREFAGERPAARPRDCSRLVGSRCR